MQTIEGYLEKGRFYPLVRTPEIKGRRRVIVTVLNDNSFQVPGSGNANKKNVRLAWLNRLESAVDSAQDEELLVVPRSKEMRPPPFINR